MLVSAGGADRSGARAEEQTALGQDAGTCGAPCGTWETLLHPGTSSTSMQQGKVQLRGLVSALDEAGVRGLKPQQRVPWSCPSSASISDALH